MQTAALQTLYLVSITKQVLVANEHQIEFQYVKIVN